MTPQVGSRLGPYEPTASIGAGGMGEVWRARDTRLARGVALKFQPEALARDADRLARFRHEAQLLNWPRELARLAAASREQP